MFQKQVMMRRVLYSLVPIYLFALFLYGWRLIFLTPLVFIPGILTELIMEKMRNKKVSEAVLVTCMLFLLSLPPRTPWWIAVVGIVFGVLFAKEVFGGFGRNPFNPAIASRLFVYISFPNQMTQGWTEISFASSKMFGIGADAFTGATPLGILREGGAVNLVHHFLGWRPGSMGESMILLIILAAVYLIVTNTASWEIIVSTVVSGGLFVLIIDLLSRTLFPGLPSYPVMAALMSGSFLFVAVFMATDPISGPKKRPSKFVYGAIIGTTAMIVRLFSLFPEGTSFGVFIGNVFASLLDELFTPKKKVAA
jgi:Na+-transporting NADH:ubiquinone oxidoreductase subunit B